MSNGLDVPIKNTSMKVVCGLDVHKDSVFAVFCVLMEKKSSINSEFLPKSWSHFATSWSLKVLKSVQWRVPVSTGYPYGECLKGQ